MKQTNYFAALAFSTAQDTVRIHAALQCLIPRGSGAVYGQPHAYLSYCRANGLNALATELFAKPTTYICIAYKLPTAAPTPRWHPDAMTQLGGHLKSGLISAFQLGKVSQLAPQYGRRIYYPEFLDLSR